MGVCASSSTSTNTGGEGKAAKSLKCPSTAKVIDMDGGLQEFKQPILAENVNSQNQNCFLCNSESMSIGSCLPQVPQQEELQPGQIYFLVPLSRAQKPLSLPELCDLAIKASPHLNHIDVCSELGTSH